MGVAAQVYSSAFHLLWSYFPGLGAVASPHLDALALFMARHSYQHRTPLNSTAQMPDVFTSISQLNT